MSYCNVHGVFPVLFLCSHLESDLNSGIRPSRIVPVWGQEIQNDELIMEQCVLLCSNCTASTGLSDQASWLPIENFDTVLKDLNIKAMCVKCFEKSMERLGSLPTSLFPENTPYESVE